MPKKTELMLSVWPNANNRQYWQATDSSRSFWLSLRSVETERTEDGMKIDLETYGPDGVCIRDIGLWVWASSGFSCNVELKAHEVYSASPFELTRLAKYLTKLCAKIDKADIPSSFGVRETLILTLRAVGIKQAVWIDPDWTSKPRYKLMSVEDALKLPNYASPLDEMESVRQRPYGSAA